MGYSNDFNPFGDDDEDFGTQGKAVTPKQLRDAYNALHAKFDEQTAALEKANGAIAQRNLKDVLTAKGLRPGLARVIAKEDVDLTDEKAVETWLSDAGNQEDFGFSLETPGGETPTGDGAPLGAGVDQQHADYAAQLAQFSGASGGALPAENAVIDQARASIKGAKTTAEIQAALNSATKNLK